MNLIRKDGANPIRQQLQILHSGSTSASYIVICAFLHLKCLSESRDGLDLGVSRAPTAHPNIRICAILKFTVSFHLMEIISYLQYHSSTYSFI